MDEKFIVWDQIALHGASPEEAFEVVKEHYPEVCDEELNKLIQQEVENLRKKEEEYKNFLIENNMTEEEHKRQMQKEADEEHLQSIKDYFMLSDKDVENNNIDVLSLEEFYEVAWGLNIATEQLSAFSRRSSGDDGASRAVQYWQERLEQTIDRIYFLSKSVSHKAMRDIAEAIYIMESKTNEKRAKSKHRRGQPSVKVDSIKQIYASLEDSYAKRNDVFEKGKRLHGSAFGRS